MRRLLALAVLCLALPASAQDLMDLLQKGPVVLVENDAKGRFKEATAVVYVDRPVGAVWTVVTDLPHYKDFMPKLVRSDVKPLGAGKADVSFEVEVPGVNTAYTFRYAMDRAKNRIDAHWVSGDIKGSSCGWRLVPYRKGTLIYYSVASRNFSSLAESLDDKEQTVTIGVNVGAALATVRAVKKRVEAGSGAKGE